MKSLRVVFTPWRLNYVTGRSEGCFLCDAANNLAKDSDNFVLHRGEHAFIIMNRYPYNTGHILIAPYRHVGDWADLTPEERVEIAELIALAEERLKLLLNPDGFNFGANIGSVAGAGLPGHVHVHLVPRWTGDSNFLPVTSDVRLVPENVEGTYQRLKPLFDSKKGEEGEGRECNSKGDPAEVPED